MKNKITEPSFQIDFFVSLEKEAKQIIETISAFANSQGGELLIGKNKKGKTVGVVPREEGTKLLQLINSVFGEALQFEIFEELDKYSCFLRLVVHKSDKKGIYCKGEHWSNKEMFVRSNGDNLLVSTIQKKVWKNLNKARHSFSSEEIKKELLEYLTDDVSFSSLCKTVKRSRSEIEDALVELIIENKVQIIQTITSTSFRIGNAVI